MKNILLPTDFSENSLNAIEYALEFFKNWECEFYVLNVQKPSEYITDDIMTASPSESIHSAIAGDNKSKLQQLVNDLNKKYASTPFKINMLFDFDNLSEAINQIIQNHSIELIVMGTNGATNAREVVFGSNTIQVIRNVNCPILAIPQDYRFKGNNKTLLCIPKEIALLDTILTPFKDLMQVHNSELHIIEFDDDVLAVSEGQENSELKKSFNDYPFEYYCLNEQIEWSVINTATQLLKTDLNAVFIEKKSFFERLILGTETPKITYRTKVPVLFLKK